MNMVFNKTESQEKEYLQYVIAVLKSTIDKTEISVEGHIKTLEEFKEYLWSNKDIDPQEIRSMRESILNHLAIGDSVICKRKRLGKILDIPYFGRIDFKDKNEGSQTVPIYIGVHAFYDIKNKISLIYDWRAPISSMFYDYELEEASYLSPAGVVTGDISLKRQYRIRNGKLEFMFESSLAIHDDVLQKELSSNADEKMKNIVATIQQEQNKIIRNDDAHVLIIQGVAGSGKTSIALHRIAYLLYAYKGNLLSQNILIISPNKVFADYISNVLPELGEETVPEISMEQILLGVLDYKYKYQTFFEQVDELLGKPDTHYIDRIKYKSSFDFISKIDAFILHIENTYFKSSDIQLNRNITIPSEFIQEQFSRFNRYPMRQRFEPMVEYILEMAHFRYRVEITTAEKNILKKRVKKMFGGNDDIQLYKDFYEWIGQPLMFKMKKGRTIEYSDLAPLAYINIALDGNKNTNRVKHLLIDEMQDYTPIQYKVLQKIFNCRKTILGDANQSVNPYGSSTADMILKTFIRGEIVSLWKSYRSTYEITSFAQKIRANEKLVPVARHGEQPQKLKFNNSKDEIAFLANLIEAFKKSKYNSLGIICKTEFQARDIADNLKIYTDDVSFISNSSFAFVNGIIITSAHMAKGLEFDEAVVPQVDEKNYHSEIDRSMLYVAVTRAMHKLTLTYSSDPSRFIEQI